MEIQIEFAEIDELVAMLNIVVSCITSLPFGMTNYRTKLKRILESKIDHHPLLEMHFYFFLLSYLDCIDVERLFRKHRIMHSVESISNSSGITRFQSQLKVQEPPTTALSSSSLPLPNTTNMLSATSLAGTGDTAFSRLRTEDVLYFNEEDPIRLFRAPLDHSASIGFTGLIMFDRAAML